MTAMSNTRKFAAAMIAVAATVAMHGGWLKAMDRDAIAATTPAIVTAQA